jgi:hypothetical protein
MVCFSESQTFHLSEYFSIVSEGILSRPDFTVLWAGFGFKKRKKNYNLLLVTLQVN